MAFTCLLIDDDPDDLEIFSLALQDAGIKCNYITARNGLDAIEMLSADEKLTPGFIFIDLNMPFLNGKGCLVEIKKIGRLTNIPAIIYTTSSNERDVKETKELGAAHYIVKPSNINLLSTLLNKIFQKEPLPFFLNEEVKTSFT